VDVTDRLTLATSTGLPFVSLAFHVAMGTVALVAGIIAIAARKGGTWHRRSGIVFVYSMLANAISASAISVYEGKSAASGLLTVYMVFTAFTAVRPLRTFGRPIDVGLMLMAAIVAVGTFLNASKALGNPRNQHEGVPAGMLFFMGTVIALAAVGDARMVWAGGVQGTRRIARHLWRMCFGLFIATGSFSAQLVAMTFMPSQFRSMGVILLLGGGPLVLLVYWMWRVRLRNNLRGLVASSTA
jgi:uncharacterized membrane protein